VIPVIQWLIKKIQIWWRESRPANRLFEGIACQSEACRIFVRDFYIDRDSKLISFEPRVGVGYVPNVLELLPDADGRAVASILNILGQVGKTEEIEVIRMSQDTAGEWNSHVFVIGGQSNKSYDFYRSMENVAYRMDDQNMYDAATDQRIRVEQGFGYGIILKALNPFKTGGKRGIGFLIAGFGAFGTKVATYYFREHFLQLGKEFGRDCFGILVRASVTAGEQAVERLDSKRF